VRYGPQLPRPSNASADPSEKEGEGGFRKSLPERVEAIKEAHPGAKVELLWAEDEARAWGSRR
jgi:hypothetical protein